jgi:hypothetical protein
VERSARQELDGQVRKVQEDAQAAKLALVAQTGVLEGQCKAATERIKQLEVRGALCCATLRFVVSCCVVLCCVVLSCVQLRVRVC